MTIVRQLRNTVNSWLIGRGGLIDWVATVVELRARLDTGTSNNTLKSENSGYFGFQQPRTDRPTRVANTQGDINV